MTATMEWIVESMSCYPADAGESDVVFSVAWRCRGTQMNAGEPVIGSIPGNQSVTYTAGSPFTPYADLTQDQVLGWIWKSESNPDGVDKDAIEAQIQAQIDRRINPPVVTPPLPWSTPAA
jgi:hypothetical protein